MTAEGEVFECWGKLPWSVKKLSSLSHLAARNFSILMESAIKPYHVSLDSVTRANLAE